MSPFLRWTGGKTKLLPEILARIPEEINTYYEPFLGGGAVLLALLEHGSPRRVVASDMNPDLIAAWLAVRDDVEELITNLSSLREFHSAEPEETFARVRSNHSAVGTWRAARCIYLTKTCFNGLWRVNKRGEFNTPIGTNWNSRFDPQHLRAVSLLIKNVQFLTCGFRSILDDINNPYTFVYCDPPYIPASATSSFESYTSDGFGMAQQTDLRDAARRLKSRGVRVLLSNSDTPVTNNLYDPEIFTVERIEVRRNNGASAGSRGTVGELLIS